MWDWLQLLSWRTGTASCSYRSRMPFRLLRSLYNFLLYLPSDEELKRLSGYIHFRQETSRPQLLNASAFNYEWRGLPFSPHSVGAGLAPSRTNGQPQGIAPTKDEDFVLYNSRAVCCTIVNWTVFCHYNLTSFLFKRKEAKEILSRLMAHSHLKLPCYAGGSYGGYA